MRTCTDIHSIIDASPARVMDALVAVERLPEWSPSYSNVRIADYDEFGRPHQVFVHAELLGNTDLQILEYGWSHNRCHWVVADSTPAGRSKRVVRTRTRVRQHTPLVPHRSVPTHPTARIPDQPNHATLQRNRGPTSSPSPGHSTHRIRSRPGTPPVRDRE
ncbi:SRPBCC family protein [Nocardia abscessus]|uniref:SRPBCC family protein n=1 Tax=Nocardia abscessus TaxID=120957 RepID=UPI002B4AB2EB|nr:SRPBCC family protein [Nocardia abscessus]